MPYVSLQAQSSILQHAIRQATCARDMAKKLPRARDIVADLDSVIFRLNERVESVEKILDGEVMS